MKTTTKHTIHYLLMVITSSVILSCGHDYRQDDHDSHNGSGIPSTPGEVGPVKPRDTIEHSPHNTGSSMDTARRR